MVGGQTPNINRSKSDEPSRGRSTIEFPYFDLDSAIEVAVAVHEVGGSSCDWDQLAAQMKQAPGGGGFRIRLMAARTFGLLTYDRGAVSLTDLGIRAVDPKFERSARVESFLTVPLFKGAYEKLKGGMLPPIAAIDRTIEGLGVPSKTKEKARQVFIRSAKQAGFFLCFRGLTLPPIKLGAPQKDTAPAPQDKFNDGGRGVIGGGDGGGPTGVHFAILGLLRELPPPGTPWNAQKKERFLLAFKSTIDVIYPEEEAS